MNNLLIYKTNPHLTEKSESEIKATNINALNGLSTGIKFYDENGRKTHTDYSTDGVVFIRKYFKDIFHDGNLVDIEIQIKWFDSLRNHISKTWKTGLDSKKIIDLKISRRQNIKNYILKEAETTSTIEVKQIFTFILNETQSSLNTWINSGDREFFYDELDDENSPITQYMELLTESGLTVKEYLKKYIK